MESQRQRIPRQERRDLSSVRRKNSIVRAAGRFSIPSDDGRSLSRSPSRTHPRISTSDSTMTIASSRSCWPTVDPEGRPIRWQIRNQTTPFPNSTSSQLGRDKDQQTKTSDRGGSPKRMTMKDKSINHSVTKVRWGRVCILIILVTGLIAFLKGGFSPELLIVLPKSFLSMVSQSVVGPSYCNSDGHENSNNCTRCPENAVCKGGGVECRKPQFRKQWRRGSVSCVKDNDIYRSGYQLFGSLADFLAQQSGFYFCNTEAVHPEGVPVKIPSNQDEKESKSIGFSKCSIMDIVFKNQFQSTQNLEVALQLLFEELVQKHEDQVRYGIRTIKVNSVDISRSCSDHGDSSLTTLFYSVLKKKTFSCLILEKGKSNLQLILSVLVCVMLPILLFQRWKLQQTVKAAIRQIIVDRTSIKSVEPSDIHQGYAIGPRAHDILYILQGERMTPWWLGWLKPVSGSKYHRYAWISKYLTETAVDKICNDLVKSDPSFCRGVLSVDMTPFYFSKRVVDNLRLSRCASDAHQPQLV